MPTKIHSDGSMVRRQVGDLMGPVRQTASKAMYKHYWLGRRTRNDMMNQRHWTIPFDVDGTTPALNRRGVKSRIAVTSFGLAPNSDVLTEILSSGVSCYCPL
jgi:hypothetical protein